MIDIFHDAMNPNKEQSDASRARNWSK